MTRFRYIPTLVLLVAAIGLNAQENKNQKIDSLLKVMTLEEKFGQINLLAYYSSQKEIIKERIKKGEIGALLKANGAANNRELQKVAVENSRLHIPLMFQEDVIHGYKTIAPVPLAEAASWDMEAIQQSASVAASEASAAGVQLTYAPMVDICRDPRWGRIMEGAGEDPYLGSEVASARVKGFQGDSYTNGTNIMACVKHFAGYGAALSGEDYAILDYSERDLRELYLPPFQAAINAGAGSLMSAYTSYNAVPASANKFLLKTVLRDQMGFKGMVITDWRTTSNLVSMGVCGDDSLAAAMALEAGIDMDMTSGILMKVGPDLIRKGKIDVKEIDRAVRNVLNAKFDMGLFENPYKYFDEEREKKEILSKENKEKALDMARKSMVLLKNDGDLLPLSRNIKTIAIIGPLAKDKKDLMGRWNCKGDEKDVISLFDGIKNVVGPSTKILYAEGCRLNGYKNNGSDSISKAIEIAKQADVIILAVGEQANFTGETAGLAGLHITPEQEQLVRAIHQTGKPIVNVLFNGRPLVLTEIADNSTSLLEAWLPGTMGGDAVADVLFGNYNPSGKLPVTFPANAGQIPNFYAKRKKQSETGYVDASNKPLFPFGFGLSYTHFEYSKIKLSDIKMKPNGFINATITLTNKGKYTGREVVQLYIGDPVCSIIRPIKELKKFSIVELKPGESKIVNFTIGLDDLYFFDKDLKKTYEPGTFKVYIGSNSSETKEISFELSS
ncbi:beta-glucosidase BglX [Pinibacter soli]|uniref:beta-glucosidase n=1 Tax=Pinibacter soli TaxID=3044211 RepID=A0ABT6RFH3_9BACT|nr:beta-glucosidase BglX [Pinibacter soli]MDI3321309.1 beta-glucosidase BglX [Pinibacter soli]